MIESFEKIPVKIFPTANDGSIMVAAQIATLIKDKQSKKKTVCLAWLRAVPLFYYTRN